MAHCIHVTDAELDILATRQAVVAHCPVSTTLLGSGIMPLDRMVAHGLDYALCTDVGASPTTSLLNEMAQFLKVHAGRYSHATPSEALFRTTLAASRMLGLSDHFGDLSIGKPASFVEIQCDPQRLMRCTTADAVIADAILEMPAAPSAALCESLDELGTGTADHGPMLERLEDDITATANKLHRKVLRVTINGATASST